MLKIKKYQCKRYDYNTKLIDNVFIWHLTITGRESYLCILGWMHSCTREK